MTNATYVWLCKELGQEHPHCRSASNVGHVFEWIVWAAYEENRYDFIVSLTAHAVSGPALRPGFATGGGAPVPIEV